MTPRHPIDHLQTAHAYRLGRIQRLLRRRLISITISIDPELSPEQFVLLLRLAEVDWLAQSELVDPALDDRANITRQVRGLIDRGLVRVRVDAGDRRRRLLALTPPGRELFERFVPQIIENRRALFGAVPASDLEAFERVLDHLENALS